MKKTIFLIMLLLGTVRLFGQDNNSIPRKWDRDFVITISHHSSMSGGSSKATFTYDSCTYFSSPRGRSDAEKKFALTQADRDKILAKLRESKVTKINATKKYIAQRDGWSTTLCYGLHCIEGGSGIELSDKDRGRFQEAYQFLEDFATNR